jgi:hypothetical protein
MSSSDSSDEDYYNSMIKEDERRAEEMRIKDNYVIENIIKRNDVEGMRTFFMDNRFFNRSFKIRNYLNKSVKNDDYLDISKFLFESYINHPEYDSRTAVLEISSIENTIVKSFSVKTFELMNQYEIVKMVLLNNYTSLINGALSSYNYEKILSPDEIERRKVLMIKVLMETWRKNYPDIDPREKIHEMALNRLEEFSYKNNLHEIYMFFLDKTIPSLYYLVMKSIETSEDLSSYIIPPTK